MAQVIEYYSSSQILKNGIIGSARNLVVSQLLLLNYRKRWGLIYAFATLAGIFCLPGAVFDSNQTSVSIISIVLKE